MSSDSPTPTPERPSRSGLRRTVRELLILVAGAAVVLGTPVMAARLTGLTASKALYLSLSMPSGVTHLMVIPVWLVGGILLLRRGPAERASWRWSLVAIVGLLAITTLRTSVYVCAVAFGGAPSLRPWLFLGEITTAVLTAVCWALLIAALLVQRGEAGGAQADSPFASDAPARAARLGWLIPCAVLGAGFGYVLNLVSDQLANSPYRLVVFVVGGCLVGLLLAFVLDSVSKLSRR